MSLDFQVAAPPYKSSSFATPEGEVLAALYNELLKLAQGEAESRLPPFRRSTAVGGDRGVFPQAKRGCTAFVAKGSAAAKRRYPPLDPAACGGL